MAIIIEDTDIHATRLAEDELRLEIALLLYQQAHFSMGRASRFSHMDRISFQKELGLREIPVNYDEAELERDVKTLSLTKPA